MSLLPHKSSDEIALTITARTFYKVLLLVLVTILLLTLLHQAVYAFTLILIALLLALALNAPVTWIARHLPGALRGNRSLAAALSFLIMIAIVVVFMVSVVPPIVRETQSFITNAPSTVQQLRAQYHGVNDFIVRYHLQSQVDQLTSDLTSGLRGIATNAFGAVTGFLGSLVAIITVLVLTLMMLVEGPVWIAFLRQLVPPTQRAHADRLTVAMYRAVRGYVNGQVLLALIASIMVLPGLLIFHVSYPFALMGLVFVCGLIPMVGHIIGALIVSFIALFYSPWSAIGILIYYILYQQVETYLIQPRVQANTTDLSPLLILLSLTVGLSLGGLFGGLVAIPVVACLRVWVLDYLETRGFLNVKPAAPVEPARN